MKTYNWTNLILKACRELSGQFHLDNQGIYGLLEQVEQAVTGQKILKWRENALNMRQKAWEICENWDIRMAGKLFEIFPGILPKKFRGQKFVAEYNSSGNWIIVFVADNEHRQLHTAERKKVSR